MLQKKNLRIVVTGANGQLGRELKVASKQYPNIEFIWATRAELDLSSATCISEFFNSQKVNGIINCAAYTAVDQAEKDNDAAFGINETAPKLLAEVAKEKGLFFIHVSTDFVFDGNSRIPYKESDDTNPIGVYARSKQAGENGVLNVYSDSIIVRTSWLYSSYGKNFVKTMLWLGENKEEIGVVDDQIGSPTYALDLAEALLKIVNFKLSSAPTDRVGGIYHFSNLGGISWCDFAREIMQQGELNCKVNAIGTKDYPTPATRPKYSVLDTIKITETFGIKIKPWKDSLRTCLEKIKLN